MNLLSKFFSDVDIEQKKSCATENICEHKTFNLSYAIENIDLNEYMIYYKCKNCNLIFKKEILKKIKKGEKS